MRVGVRVLGPVGLEADGAAVPVPAGKPLAALAMLALAGGRSVAVDELVVGLWGEDASASAAKTLQVHLSTLRSRLRDCGAGVARTPGGYALHVDPDTIDVVRFERLTDQGLAALAEGHADVGARVLRSALEEWHGDPLSNVMDSPFAAHEADRLRLRRLAVRQARIDSDLALGLGRTLVDEVREIAEANRYDERACAQLIVALYRAGQPAAGLDVYQSFRATLADELGLEPGPELVALEQQVLTHDARLFVRPAPLVETRRDNLPEEVSNFVGRVDELAVLRDYVRRSRLTTVTGAGGSGKTRLAVVAASELVEEFTDGVWLVELAPLSGPQLVTSAVAQAIGVGVDASVDGLIDGIAARSQLVVLDNCEHLIDTVAELAAVLLRRCPNLRILATSREPLAIDGERVYRVPSLTMPAGDTADPDELRRSDAVALFADRAGLQRKDFVVDTANVRTITQICERLDGLPLAIELAAARLRTLPLDELARRLNERFRLLTGSSRRALGRQQTLRALIDWSYDLLSADEQLMLDQLSVFVGGFAIDAIEAIWGDVSWCDPFELLTALVDKSLVEVTEDSSGRFRLLETIREYSAEQLARRGADVATRARLAHAAHYLALAETAAPAFEQGSAEWLERLTVEHGNLRAAAATFTDQPDRIDDGFRLVNSLRLYWDIVGHFAEGAATTAALLEHPAAVADTSLYGRALCTSAEMLDSLGDLDRSRELAGRALTIADRVGDPTLKLIAAITAALADSRRGLPERAHELLDDCDLSQATPYLCTRFHMSRGSAFLAEQDLAGARSALEAAATSAERAGEQRRLGLIVMNLAVIDVAEGQLEHATFRLQESLALATLVGDRTTVAYIYVNLGLVALRAQDPRRAANGYRDSLVVSATTSEVTVIHIGVLGMAMCANDDELEVATMLHGFVDAAWDNPETVLDPTEVMLRRAHRQRLRDTFGDAEFERLLAQGAAFTLPEVVEIATRLAADPL